MWVGGETAATQWMDGFLEAVPFTTTFARPRVELMVDRDYCCYRSKQRLVKARFHQC